MVSVLRLLPAVLLCVALLGPTSVEARSFTDWIIVICNFFRTLFYYFIPVKRKQVEAIDATLSELADILKGFIPETSPLKNYESSKNGAYVCMAEGFAANMKTLKKIGKARCLWDSDNSVNVKIPFTIEDFRSGYGVVYMQVLKASTQRGTLDISFGKNRMVVGVLIPNVLKMIGKLTAGDPCVVNITRIDVTHLQGVKLNLHSDGLTGGVLTSKFFTFVLNNRNRFLKQSVREAFLENMLHQMSNNPKNTVCIHPSLMKEIQALRFLAESEYSKQFNKHCGKNRGLTTIPQNNEQLWKKMFKKRRKSSIPKENQGESVKGVEMVPLEDGNQPTGSDI